MQKWWSVLFGAVMVAAVLLFLVAPFMGWWLPKNVSTYGDKVDSLFYLILFITGFFFVLTESLLIYFMYIYAAGPGTQEHTFGHHYAEKKVLWTSFFKKIARPITAVIHNQHRLELFWTFVPAVILLYIAFAQVQTWAEIKYYSRMPNPGQQTINIEVSARQFEWRMRYPSPARMREWEAKPELAKDFGDNPHEDDIHVVNEVHVCKDHKVLVHLKTRDVIHSFFLPNLRIKQDALPGKTIPVWFQSMESNTAPKGDKWEDGYDPKSQQWDQPQQVWELVCAELCGWGHYKMQGRLYVHETREDFEKWLRSAQAKEIYPKTIAAR